MPEIHEHQSEQFYDGEDRLLKVTVDIDADSRRDASRESITVVERLRQAVRREAQQIQDELDTEGKIEDD